MSTLSIGEWFVVITIGAFFAALIIGSILNWINTPYEDDDTDPANTDEYHRLSEAHYEKENRLYNQDDKESEFFDITEAAIHEPPVAEKKYIPDETPATTNLASPFPVTETKKKRAPKKDKAPGALPKAKKARHPK